MSEEGAVGVVERRVVKGLWDGCLVKECLGCGKGIPDQPNRVPLFLLFDLHYYYLLSSHIILNDRNQRADQS